ncbi:hypothetical protein PENTCL1PPCAC_15213, partial [Pristionchus entomophagus]
DSGVTNESLLPSTPKASIPIALKRVDTVEKKKITSIENVPARVAIKREAPSTDGEGGGGEGREGEGEEEERGRKKTRGAAPVKRRRGRPPKSSDAVKTAKGKGNGPKRGKRVAVPKSDEKEEEKKTDTMEVQEPITVAMLLNREDTVAGQAEVPKAKEDGTWFAKVKEEPIDDVEMPEESVEKKDTMTHRHPLTMQRSETDTRCPYCTVMVTDLKGYFKHLKQLHADKKGSQALIHICGQCGIKKAGVEEMMEHWKERKRIGKCTASLFFDYDAAKEESKEE